MLAEDPTTQRVLQVLGWVLWGVFVGEFVLRAWVAKDQRAFWRRNWWQVAFLAVPFLRFARALTLLRFTRVARVARAGSVLSAAVRGSRSGGRLLSGRVAWLALVTAVVVLSASQLLLVLGAHDSFATALHDAALATVTGNPLSADGAAARVLEVVLGVYSVVVFATLAGALGAYFLARPREQGQREAAGG
jgi:voltage-gated potassium channel